MANGDVYYANKDIRKIIDSGVFIGPRLTGAAHYISITGDGGDVNYFPSEQTVTADGSEDIRKAIRK
jgi:hypothetical protein